MALFPHLNTESPPQLTSVWWGEDEKWGLDHRGHRLLMDQDGTGSVEVLCAPPLLELVADGCPVPGPTAFYQRDFVATSRESGSFGALSTFGDWREAGDLPVSGDVVLSKAKGAGIVMWSGESLWMEGNDIPLRQPSLEHAIPVPFWTGFASSVALSVQFASCEIHDLGRITPAAEEGDWPWRVKNGSAPSLLRSLDGWGTEIEAPVMSHLNAMNVTLGAPLEEGLIVLTKTYDAFHGRQRARVLVEGEFVGWWHLPLQDRVRRWRSASFLIPSRFLKGNPLPTITIDPPAGAPLWSLGTLSASFVVLD